MVKGQGHSIRSKVKFRVCVITLDPVEIDLIFIMHVYFLKLHILDLTFGPDMSRSRSSFKVKG